VKILVVDDESLALKRLTRMLQELGESLVGFESPNDALEYASKNHFDIALLDINMPEIDGKELALKLLEKNPNSFIIFQSAYEEHALEAFKIGAIDYLLKPFSKEQLKLALKRAKEYHLGSAKKFLLKRGDESYLVSQSDIYYIEADLSEVIIRSKEEFFYYKDKISDIEKELSKNFFRVHRSFIINVDKIKQIKTLSQSRLQFSFEGIDDVVVSSKDGARKFREFFN
jgi:two-component system LytT family response regulator